MKGTLLAYKSVIVCLSNHAARVEGPPPPAKRLVTAASRSTCIFSACFIGNVINRLSARRKYSKNHCQCTHQRIAAFRLKHPVFPVASSLFGYCYDDALLSNTRILRNIDPNRNRNGRRVSVQGSLILWMRTIFAIIARFAIKLPNSLDSGTNWRAGITCRTSSFAQSVEDQQS